jgi:hypothetical protein
LLLVLLGLGVVIVGTCHVITGSEAGVSIVRRQSLGFSEFFVNVDAITNMPYFSAKSRYPLGCRVLQDLGLIESDEQFNARIRRKLEAEMDEAQRKAEAEVRRLVGEH